MEDDCGPQDICLASLSWSTVDRALRHRLQEAPGPRLWSLRGTLQGTGDKTVPTPWCRQGWGHACLCAQLPGGSGHREKSGGPTGHLQSHSFGVLRPPGAAAESGVRERAEDCERPGSPKSALEIPRHNSKTLCCEDLGRELTYVDQTKDQRHFWLLV